MTTGLDEFCLVIRRLLALLDPDEEFRPAPETLDEAMLFVLHVYQEMGDSFGRAAVAGGVNDDISFYWNRPPGQVEVIIHPGNKPPALYHAHLGSSYEFIENVTPAVAAAHIGARDGE